MNVHKRFTQSRTQTMFPSGEKPRVLATQVLVGSPQHEDSIYSIHVVPVLAAFLLEEPCIATWQAEVASWLPVLLTPQGPAAALVASPATPGAVVGVPSGKPGPVQRKQTHVGGGRMRLLSLEAAKDETSSLSWANFLANSSILLARLSALDSTSSSSSAERFPWSLPQFTKQYFMKVLTL